MFEKIFLRCCVLIIYKICFKNVSLKFSFMKMLFLDDEFFLVMLTSKQGELSIWKLYGNVSWMLLFKKPTLLNVQLKCFRRTLHKRCSCANILRALLKDRITLNEHSINNTGGRFVQDFFKNGARIALRAFPVSWDIHLQISILLLFILMWCLSVMKLLNGSSRWSQAVKLQKS